MRSSKITARLISVVLAVMMLFSLVTVGFSASAAKVEVAQTGVTMTGGEKLYLTPNSNWKADNARYAIYVFGTGDAWVSMTAVAGEKDLYEVTVPAGSWTNVIFCRMNPGNAANNWDNKWNQTSDLTYDGVKNWYTVKSGTWDKGGGTWATYTPADAVAVPAAPAAATVAVTATGGTGTEADPYLVAPEQAVEMTVTGVLGGATGLAYNVDYTAAKVDLAAGQTSVMYTGVTAPAVDETKAINVYLWAYNKEGSIQKYSETYSTTTIYVKGAESTGSEDDETFTLPYQKVDGLYAYAGTEVAGTNAWQRWDEVNSKRYFYLPASASATEVIILNTYSATVMINGVAIPAGQYAAVPYVDGTTYTCSGATTQSVKIEKTDAEGSIYINSAVGMTTKNDAGTKTTIEDATYDLYAFMTSGSKNQEVAGAAAAVASEENGVDETAIVKKMKGRGNSTWNLSKKPFNITYEENIQIDGMKGKKWSLLANAQDSSLLRNRLVYDLANEVGMKYACDSRFVDMFVNGDYKGSYQLTQKIEMGNNTVMPDLKEPIVEVEKEGDVVPTENFDFILELDTAINAGNAGDQYFTTDRNQVMTHKVPDEPTDAQVAFMDAKYQALENALYGDDLATLATLVDINDFARAYLVNEVAKNLDSGVTSCYFVYSSANDIFYMSPVWDYDNALGNSENSGERKDASGNVLDLKAPTGWYAKELMHYDSNFKGGRSVFSQACYMTSKTADGKSFMDIVKAVWAADFADIADILTGDAAATGRLQTVDGYLANLAKSGAWNYSNAGWQLSNKTNNNWISNHSTLTMYDYNAEDNTVVTSVKTYDQTKFEDQARYAADWMLSRINWMSAQFNEADASAPEGYATVYFTNNWNFQDMYVYYWGGTTGTCKDWPGDAMAFAFTNDSGEDVYFANIPTDVTGFLFNGQDDQNPDNRRQTVDITTAPVDNAGFYCKGEEEGKITVGTWEYDPDGGNTDTPVVPDEPEEPTLNEDGTKTIYFSNNKHWEGTIYAYYWYTTAVAAEGDATTTVPEYPGTKMTLVETNEYGEDIYSVVIPGDVENILFNADGKDETKTVDIDATKLSTNTGVYVADSAPYYGTYTYTPSTNPEATKDEEPAVPITEEMTVYFTNNWNFQDVYVYYWGTEDVAAPEWPGVEMTFVETNEGGEKIYSAVLPVGTTGFLFNGESDTPSTNEDGEEYYARRQTVDIVAAEVTKTGFYCDTETEGKIEVGTYDYVPYVPGTPGSTDAPTTDAPTTDAPTTDAPTTDAPTTDAPVVETETVFLKPSANWQEAGAWFAVYYWTAAGDGWVTMTATEDAGVYTAALPSDATGVIFVRMSVDATKPGWNNDTEPNRVWGQTANLTLPTDKTQNMFAMDAGWDGTGKWTAYDATPEQPDTTVKVAGSFTEWAEGALNMTADETGKVYTVSDVRLDAGTYTFKIIEFGTWLGNNGTIENTADGWTFRAKDEDGNDVGDCTLKTKGGLYTFTFDTETDKLTVTATLDVYTYDVTWNEGNFTVDAPASIDEATDLTFTVTPAEGYKVSAVIVDMALLEAVDGVYTVANVKGDVNILVIVSEVVTEPAVMQFTVTFTDKDGNTIDTQTVEYGKAATAPEAPVVEGFNFTGWDTAFDYVTKDITVKATYKKISAPVVPATTGKLKIEVTGGTGFTISVNDGAARPQGTSYQNTKTPIGATVTVVANGTNEFLGWMNESGAIVSVTDTYTFVTSGNDYLKAVYMTVVEGVNVVTFKNGKAAGGNGQIIDMQYYAAGDEVVFPDAPTAAGYDFTGWDMDAEAIQAKLAAGEDVTVLATWEAAKIYIDIVVNGGTASTAAQSNGKYLAYNAFTVVADAAPAGQKFAYWVDGNGNIMSYDAEYKSFPAASIELTAVFVAEDEVITKQPLVFIAGDPTTSGEKITYTLSWDVDASIGTVTSVGLMVVNKADYNADTFFHGSGDSKIFDRALAASATKQKNTYSIGKSGSYYDNTYIACTFVVYTDAVTGESVTVYSDLIEVEKLG